MELIALGTYGPYPCAGSATSGYLLKVEGCYYLFDMGSGVYERLLCYIDNIDDVKAIFLSHLHYDHISDFSIFKYAASFKAKRGLINRMPVVYHPDSPAEVSEGLYFGDTFEHRSLTTNTHYDDGTVQITFFPMRHPVETYGFRVKGEGKTFVYTSDTAYHDGLMNMIEDADLLVINCGYLNRDKPEVPFHLTTEEVAGLVKQGRVKRALATHFFAENSQEEINAEVASYGLTNLEPIVALKSYSL